MIGCEGAGSYGFNGGLVDLLFDGETVPNHLVLHAADLPRLPVDPHVRRLRVVQTAMPSPQIGHHAH